MTVTAVASNSAPHPILLSGPQGAAKVILLNPVNAGPEGPPQPSGTSLLTILTPAPPPPLLCLLPLRAFPAPPPEPLAPMRPHSPYPVQFSPPRVSLSNRLRFLCIYSGLSALLSQPCHTHCKQTVSPRGGDSAFRSCCSLELCTQTDAQPGTQLRSMATE